MNPIQLLKAPLILLSVLTLVGPFTSSSAEAKTRKTYAKKQTKKKNKRKKTTSPVVDHYRVVPTDSLSIISIKLYGTTRYGAKIFLWNKHQLHSMNDLEIGMYLQLKKKRTLAKATGEDKLLRFYRKKFGLTGEPQIARATVGQLRETSTSFFPPPPASFERSRPPVAPLAITTAIEEERIQRVEEDAVAESINKGEESLKQNDLPAAKSYFAEARTDDPMNPTPRILEISTLLQMGNEAEAKERVQDLVKQDSEYCELPIIKNLAEGACP